MTDTKKLIAMVELLPQREQGLVYELVACLLPDDIATPEDLEDIEQARIEYESGETLNLDALGL